mgnify:FL=1
MIYTRHRMYLQGTVITVLSTFMNVFYNLFVLVVEAPWVFKLTKSHISQQITTSPHVSSTSMNIGAHVQNPAVHAYVSIADFNSLENHIFMPDWLMKHLVLSTGDIITLEWQSNMQNAKSVSIRPDKEWKQFLNNSNSRVNDHNSTSIIKELETALAQYTTVTSGSVIKVPIHGKVLSASITDVKNGQGTSLHAGLIQDSDVQINFDLSKLR